MPTMQPRMIQSSRPIFGFIFGTAIAAVAAASVTI